MALINLLPWRELQREEQKQEFLYALGMSVIAALIIICLVHLTLSAMVHTQTKLNNALQQEIANFDQQIKDISSLQKEKELLIARMNIIKTLQVDRSHVVHIFDDIVKVLPDGVYLTNVKQQGNQLIFTGRAESNTRISTLMRNIEHSVSMTQPILTEIKNDENLGSYSYSFILQVQQKTQNSAKKSDSTKKSAS